MADWTTFTNGSWTDAARWTGGVPNAAGAVANFAVSSAGDSLGAVLINAGVTVTVGSLNFTTDTNDSWSILGGSLANPATLRFQNLGGLPAYLTTNINAPLPDGVTIGSSGGAFRIELLSDLVISTANLGTRTGLAGPIVGFGDIYKFGDGTLRLFGGIHSFIGDYYLNGGRTELSTSGVLNDGTIVFNHGAVFASIVDRTLANDFETSRRGGGAIAANTGTTLTLTGLIDLRSTDGGGIHFGSESGTDTGTVVLAGTSRASSINGGFEIDSGTVRFGNASSAANFFASIGVEGDFEINSGAILDTAGFATTIVNLDLDGGTILSSSGALALAMNQTRPEAFDQGGIIVGTALADAIIVNVTDAFSFEFATFDNWSDADDTITLNGNSAANQITGSDRNDIMNGNAGIDTMIGRDGDDWYFVDDAADAVIEVAGEGALDRILASISYALAAGSHIEVLSTANDLGTEAIDLAGDDLSNKLIGNAGDNRLTGGLGNDVLEGLGGLDTAVLSGVRSGVQISRAIDGTIAAVDGADGGDTLTNIERLEFADGTMKFAFHTPSQWTASDPGADGWNVGDFNGDGKDDVFRYVPGTSGADMFLSTGTGFAGAGSWTASNYGSDGTWHIGDFNGDGKDDIFRYLPGQSGADMFLSNGAAFVSGGSWTGFGFGSDGTWHIGDFNGDGRDDVFRYLPGVSGADMFLSDGTAFVAVGSWTGFGNGSDGTWHVGDFNGDGRDDIFRYLPGTSGADMFLSDGAAFVSAGSWTGFGKGADDKWYIGDFDGDGKDDLLRYMAGQSGGEVLLSTGSAFAFDGSWTSAGNGADGWTVGDFNGDGNGDLMRVFPTSTEVLI